MRVRRGIPVEAAVWDASSLAVVERGRGSFESARSMALMLLPWV